jgi:hypothetical protein
MLPVDNINLPDVPDDVLFPVPSAREPVAPEPDPVDSRTTPEPLPAPPATPDATVIAPEAAADVVPELNSRVPLLPEDAELADTT